MKERILISPNLTVDMLDTCLSWIKYYKGIERIFQGKLDANKIELLHSIKPFLLAAKKPFMEYNAYITCKYSQSHTQNYSKCNVLISCK